MAISRQLDKKSILSWCLFDFANSSYSAVIAAVVFPVYYANIVVGNENGNGDLWWGRAISLSMAVIAISSPFLGGIADYVGLRKRLLLLYTALSICAIAGFSLLDKGMIMGGFFMILVANIGMEGGLVFYNSFLPEIVHKEYHGRVSAWGFGTGYAGSIISLLIAIPFVKAGSFELVWFMVALFFLVFSLPAFIFLPSDKRNNVSLIKAGTTGVRYTIATLKELWNRKETRKFLLAYLIYEDGINTVIIFSSLFAAATLGFKPQELIVLYIVVQVTALIGAFIMAKPIDVWGPKTVVITSLIMWSIVVMAAFFVQTKTQFWGIATFAGLGLGTVQAATRAFYMQFIPQEKESEYFGIYSLVGKSSAIIGPLVFGFLSSAFGSQRPAILSIAVFFILGTMILSFVRGGGPNVTNAK
ncbi:MAG: MFS transporter [Deltaproteobacteria bacterium]|nr:MFS transporter [Deltaproteobacteria bacterium]